jgi:hypothetical protein
LELGREAVSALVGVSEIVVRRHLADLEPEQADDAKYEAANYVIGKLEDDWKKLDFDNKSLFNWVFTMARHGAWNWARKYVYKKRVHEIPESGMSDEARHVTLGSAYYANSGTEKDEAVLLERAAKVYSAAAFRARALGVPMMSFSAAARCGDVLGDKSLRQAAVCTAFMRVLFPDIEF